MKILCLHPWGASAEIFEKQMSLICSMIGESHDYVFLDGPVSCGPAKEVPRNVPGPFYNWYDGLSSSQARDAHDLVKDVIEDDGPFDGVIGFSQGASLALSILYHHEIRHPDRPPPFRFAIFFCAVLSISPDPMFNADLVAKYSRYYKRVKHDEESEKHKTTMAELERGDFIEDGNRGTATHKLSRLKNHRAILLLPGQKAALVKELFALVRQLVDHGAEHDLAARTQWNTRGGMEGFPRVYHPLVNTQRIPIPTVHIIGRSDPLRRHSELQARLCSKELTRVVEFEGVHKVPHRMNDVQAVLKAVEWAMRMAQMR
ncbi:serine hydrolase-domain-containing protein [Aspergillus karnatakaensis]|uniref:serine hydrolase-domain-containing protein n=1 Tax=Aspergillus karnatakaensis TaxID=1810916 RepID=UPI003CCE438E